MASLEVRLRPGVPGCFIAVLNVLTLGLFGFLSRLGERHFIRHMDDVGVETRSGKRIAWSEFTRIRRMAGTMGGARLSDEYLLTSAQGHASLPLWRAENADEAREFLLKHLRPDIETA